MKIRLLGQWVGIGALMLTTGCAGNVRVMMSELEQQTKSIELVDTPFYPQITDQCGPSALAAILNVTGVNVTPSVLKSSIYIPDRQGSLQLEMLAATRSYQRIPYTLDPDVKTLVSELQAGRPVLVLQNLGSSFAPVWHYAVVVGYLPDEKRFVLRSGDQERLRVKASTFIRSWRRADYWAFVALKPGTVPDNADVAKYLSALAAFESTGGNANTIAAYEAAVVKWPENTLAQLGLGNAYYAVGQLERAQAVYTSLLRTDQHNAIVLNNLAQVLAEQGAHSNAVQTIDTALSVADIGSPTYRLILQTREEISMQSHAPQER